MQGVARVSHLDSHPFPKEGKGWATYPFATPRAARVSQFQNILIKAGIPAYIRRPRGRDIYAACGQLKHTTELVQLA